MSDPKRVDAGGGVAEVAQLLQLLGGQTQTTQSSANTQQLQQILSQLQGQDPQALLQSIFAQAAGQMPGLQARYSNAVGGRTANNGAVQASLEKLLADTTIQAQQKLADQQLKSSQIQSDIASTMAKLNSRQTQSVGTDIGQAAKMIGGLQAVGKLLDSDLGKKGRDLFAEIFSSGGDSTVTDTGAAFDFSGMLDSVDFGSSFTDQAGLTFGDAVSDLFGESDWLSDIGDGGGLFDWGFKDGGLVGRDNVQHFAEGGVVRAGGGRRSSAPVYTPDEILRSRVANAYVNSNSKSTAGEPGPEDVASSGGISLPPIQNISSGNNFTFGTGNLTDKVNAKDIEDLLTVVGKLGLGMATGVSLPGLTTGPLGVLMKMIQLGLRQERVMADINASGDPIAAMAVAQGWIPGSQVSTDVAVAAANALSRVGGTDPMDELMELTDAFGTKRRVESDEIGDTGGGSSSDAWIDSSGDSGGGGDGIGGSIGDTIDTGDVPVTEDYKNGGKVSGPGTGTSDSIPARLSNGEYVVSADVVQALGTGFFDHLQNLLHKTK